MSYFAVEKLTGIYIISFWELELFLNFSYFENHQSPLWMLLLTEKSRQGTRQRKTNGTNIPGQTKSGRVKQCPCECLLRVPLVQRKVERREWWEAEITPVLQGHFLQRRKKNPWFLSAGIVNT